MEWCIYHQGSTPSRPGPLLCATIGTYRGLKSHTTRVRNSCLTTTIRKSRHKIGIRYKGKKSLVAILYKPPDSSHTEWRKKKHQETYLCVLICLEKGASPKQRAETGDCHAAFLNVILLRIQRLVFGHNLGMLNSSGQKDQLKENHLAESDSESISMFCVEGTPAVCTSENSNSHKPPNNVS